MKKLLYILLAGVLLVGCNSIGSAKAEDTPKEEVTYSLDDLAFYSELDESGQRTLMMWPGMTEEDMKFDDDDFKRYYSGFDTIQYYKPVIKSEQQMMEMTAEKAKERVKFLSYTGGRMSISTVKDIMTTGFDPVEGKANSTKDDVIKYYGLDPDNESIYASVEDENFSTIILYFKVDEAGNVTRVVSPKDTDIDSITSVDANASIKFLIIDNEVRNIQMYRDFEK